MDTIEFDGQIWRKRKDGYYRNSKKQYLHRYIYEQHHGPIAPGYVVHHADHDPTNNDVSNLVLMRRSEHHSHHSTGRSTSDKQKQAASATFVRMWQELELDVKSCIGCGQQFESKSVHKTREFCSSKCLEKWRANAFQPETRQCVECKTDYVATRRVQKYCSESCNQAAATRRYRADRPIQLKRCQHCGNAYESKRENARFCSRPCAVRYHGKNQRRRKIKDAGAGL